ncbi:MAG: PfkB family carbohydrate kinase [Desulfobacteraceae bacterium]
MIIVIGEILVDRFPDYERIGGAPFNFAFHLKNLGWPVRLITRIGDDEDGRKISRLLENNGFNLEDIQVDPALATGRVEVSLDSEGIPQFDICKNVAYDHLDLSSGVNANAPDIDMIYFGSLIQRTTNGFEQMRRFLGKHAAASTCFCDINLRPPHIRAEAIESSLVHADLLKLNHEELAAVSRLFKGPHQENEIAEWLLQTYRIDAIALTRGSEGSTYITIERTIDSAPTAAVEIMDTVGAGDAYASIIAAGTLSQLPMEQTLRIATDFSAQVCSLTGAIPDSPAFYTRFQNDLERIGNAQ